MNRRRRGFALLEVLVSLAIMGVSLSMVLRSFTTSLKASNQSRKITTAVALSRSLIDQWEMQPPTKGVLRGDFGKENPDYAYEGTYSPQTADYPGVTKMEAAGRLAPFQQLRLDVYYANAGDREQGTRKRLLRIESALTGSERFTPDSRVNNKVDIGN